jgi:uncharacterized membrane protein
MQATRRDERGSVLVLTALLLVVLMGALALSFDIGRAAVAHRTLQAVVDSAALDARSALGTAACDVTDAALHSAERNGFPSGQGNSLTAVPGQLVPASGLLRFDPVASWQPGDPCPGATAVQVDGTTTVPFRFAPGSARPSATAAAYAYTKAPGCPPTGCPGGGSPGGSLGPPVATIAIGSELAAVDPTLPTSGPAALPDALLGGLLGASPSDPVQLTVGSYEGLGQATVTLGGLAAALGLGSPTELSTATLTYGQLVAATAGALESEGDTADASVVSEQLGTAVSQAANADATLGLGQLLEVAAPGSGSAADATVEVLPLLVGGAELANGSHTVAIDLGSLGLPGVADVEASLEVTEPPAEASGPAGNAPDGKPYTEATTAQVELSLVATTDPVSLAGLPSPVSLAVPLVAGAAQGTAVLQAIGCTGYAPDDTATVGAQTGLASLALGSQGSSGGTEPGTILEAGLPGATVTVTGEENLVQEPASGVQTLVFGPSPQAVQGQGLAPNPVEASDLTVTVSGVGGLDLGALASAVASALDPLVATLDQQVVEPAMAALGASVAGAEVWNPSITCTGLG